MAVVVCKFLEGGHSTIQWTNPLCSRLWCDLSGHIHSNCPLVLGIVLLDVGLRSGNNHLGPTIAHTLVRVFYLVTVLGCVPHPTLLHL